MRRTFKKTFTLAVAFIILVVCGRLLEVSAQSSTPTPPLSCEISIYKTQEANLPVSSRTRVAKDADLNAGDRYVYTFNLKSQYSSQEKIQSISINSMAGKTSQLQFSMY